MSQALARRAGLGCGSRGGASRTWIVAAACCLLASAHARASDATFAPADAGAAGNYSWTTDANWSPAAAPGFTGDTATLSALGSAGANTTITLGQTVTLGSLVITNSNTSYNVAAGNSSGLLVLDVLAGTAGITVSNTGAQTISVPMQVLDDLIITNSGAGALSISGDLTTFAARTITFAGTGGVTLSGDILLAATTASALTLADNGAGSHVITGDIILGAIANTANTLVITNANAMTIGGIRFGAGTVTKNGAGQLTISANNANNRGATNVTLGVLNVTGGNAIGDISTISIAASQALNVFQSETIGGFTAAAPAGTITIQAGQVLRLNQIGNATTVAAVISGGGSLMKAGAGSLTLTGINTLSGSVTVSNGILRLQTGGRLALASGVNIIRNGLTGTSASVMLATTTADVDKIGNAATVTLSGGRLDMNNITAAQGRTETIGTLALIGGANQVTLTAANAATTATVSIIASGGTPFIRNSGATLVVQGTNLGDSTIPGNNARLIVGTLPAGSQLIGGVGGAGTNTISILPWAVGQTVANNTAVGTPNSFLTYDGTNGFRPLNLTTEYLVDPTVSTFAVADDNANIRFTATSSPATQPLIGRTINSLLFDSSAAAFAVTGSGTLLVNSGGLLFTSTTPANGATLAGFNQITTGTTYNQFYIHVYPTTVTIGSNLANAASGTTDLIKSGSGTLVLSAPANNYLGTTYFNEGLIQATTLLQLGAGGPLTFQGGGLQWGTGANFDISSRTVSFGTGGGILDVGANNVTFASAIGNNSAGGINKRGTGLLTLAENNTYGGSTIISAGTLSVGVIGSENNTASGLGKTAAGFIDPSSGINASIILNAAALRYTGAGETTDRGILLTVAGNTINQVGSGALIFDRAVGDSITSLGTSSLTVSGTANIAFMDALNIAATTLTVSTTGTVTFGSRNFITGTSTFNGGTIVALADQALTSGTLVIAAAPTGLVTLDIGATTQSLAALTIFGGTSSTTSTALINGTGVIRLGGTMTANSTGNNLGATVSPIIYLTGNRTIAVGDSTGTTNELTILNGIQGDAGFGFSKTSTGTLVVLGNSTYTGATTISAGALRASFGAGLSSATNVIFGGGVLEGNGTLTNSLGASALSFSWLTSTLGGFAANGGTFTISLNNGGALVLGSTVGFADGVGSTSGLLFGSTSADSVTNFTNNVNIQALTFAVSVTDNTTTTSDWGEISGALSGTGTLNKLAAGVLRLSNDNNTFSGAIVLGGSTTPGVLEFTSMSAGGAVSALGTGTTANTITLSNTTTLAGTLRYVGTGGHTSDRNIFISTATTSTTTFSHNGSGAITLSGNITGQSATGTGTFIVTNSNDMTISGALSAATGTLSLTKYGVGVLTLSGANTYNGITTMGSTTTNGGTIRLSGVGQVSPVVNLLNGTLDLNGINQTLTTLTMGTTLTGSSAQVLTGGATLGLTGNLAYTANPGGATISGTLSLSNAAHTLTIANSTTVSGDLVITGGITGETGASLIKQGTGTFVIDGVSSYDGTTTLTAGAIRAAFGAGLSSNSNVLFGGGVIEGNGVSTFTASLGTGAGQIQWASGLGGGFAAFGGTYTININNGTSTLDVGTAPFVNGAGGSLIFGSLSADSVVDFQNGLNLNGNTLTVSVVDNTLTTSDWVDFSGVISGAGSLIKTNSGVLRLSNTGNTFDGQLTLSGGVLEAASLTNFGGGNSSLGNPTTAGNSTINISGGTLRYIGVPDVNLSRALNVVTAGTFDVFNSGTTVTLTGITASTASITLAGAGNGVINSPGIIYTTTGAGMIFNTTGAWTISGVGASNMGDVSVNAGTVSFNASSIIGSTGDDLVVTGSTSLAILNAANVSAGDDIFIRNGATLRLGINSAFSVAGGIDDLLISDSTGSGGTLDMNDFNADVDALTLGSSFSGTITGSGTLTIATGIAFQNGVVGPNVIFGVSTATLTMTLANVATFSGTGNQTGATTVNNGQLVIDFVSTNNQKLSNTGALNMNSGRLSLIGNASAASTEQVGALSLTSRHSIFDVTSNHAAGATLSLSSLGRLAGTTLNINYTNNTGTAAVTTTTANVTGGNGVLAGFVTVGNMDWAVASGAGPNFAITALGSYTTQNDLSLWGANGHITTTGALTGTLTDATIASLRLNSADAQTITIAADNRLRIANGGILLTAAQLANGLTITGGQLMGGAQNGSMADGAEIYFHNYGTGNLTLASTIRGTSTALTFFFDNPGTVTLSGSDNSYRGATSIDGGTMISVGSNAIGNRSSVQVFAGSTWQLLQDETVGAITGSGTINLGGRTLVSNQAASGVFTGTISGGGTLIKTGAGNLQIANISNAFSGTVIVNRGLLFVSGTNSTNFTGTTYTISPGASFLIDNNSESTAPTNRIPDGSTLTLSGYGGGAFGTLAIRSNRNSTQAENVGAVVLAGGTISIIAESTSTASAVTVLTMSSMTRNNFSTLYIAGRNLAATGTGPLTQIYSTAAPTLVGGSGVAGTTNVSIIPWAVGTLATGAIGAPVAPTGFVTYDVTGFRVLTTSEYVTDPSAGTFAALVNTDNLQFTTTSSGLGGRTINALFLNKGAGVDFTVGGSGALTLASGALLFGTATAGGSIVLNGFSDLQVGAGNEYLVTVGQNITTSAPLTAQIDANLSTVNAALVKSGLGTLVLTTINNTYAGGTYINQGLIRLDSIDRLGTGAVNFYGGGIQWATGATFDINTATRTLNVASGGAILDTNGNDVTLTGLLSSAAGSGSFSSVTKIGAGTLTLTANNTFTGLLTIATGTLSVAMLGNEGQASPLGQQAVGSINPLHGSAGSVVLGGGTLVYTGAGETTNRAFNLSAASTFINNGGTITFSPLGSTAFFADGNLALTLTGTGGGYIDGDVDLGTGILNIIGPGTDWTINGVVSGDLLFNGANLTLGQTFALGRAVTLGQVIGATVLNIGAFDQEMASLTLLGGTADATSSVTVNGSGTIWLGGNVTYNNTGANLGATISSGLELGAVARTFTVGDSAGATIDLLVSGPLSSNAPGNGIVKAGTGVMRLGSASSTFSGTVSISAGVLEVAALADANSASSIGTGGLVSTISLGAATFRYAGTTGGGHATNRTIQLTSTTATLDASGVGPVTFSGNLTTTQAMTLSLTGSSTGTLANVIQATANTAMTLSAVGAADWFVGNVTYAGANTTSIVLSGDGSGTIFGTISSAASNFALTKIGTGTWTLTQPNGAGLTSASTIVGGQLVLDFSSNTSTKLNTGVTMNLGGPGAGSAPVFSMLGNTTSSATQTFTSLTVLAGSSTVNVNSQGQDTTLTFGAITRAVGSGIVRFTTTGSNASIVTTQALSNNILGGFALFDDGWATKDGFNVIGAFTGYTNQNDISLWTAGTHINNTAAYTGTVGRLAINTLRFDAAAASTISQETGTILSLVNGGLLITSDVGANTTTITGGVLASGAGNEVILTIDSTGGLDLNSSLLRNGILTKNGAGSLTLSGFNFNTGATTVNEGALNLSGGASVGDLSLLTTANRTGVVINLNDTNETVGGLSGGGTTGGGVNLGSATLRLSQSVSSTYGGVISGTGSVVKTGTGLAALTASSTFDGGLTVLGGTASFTNSGAILSVDTITIAGGVLFGDQSSSSTINRFSNTASIVMLGAGSTLAIQNTRTTSRGEQIDTVSLSAGANIVTLTNTSTNTNSRSILTTSSLLRGGNSTLLVRGINLGTASTTVTSSRYLISGGLSGSAAQVGGTGGAGTTTIAITPYAIGDNSLTGNGTTFLTLDTNGLRTLTTSEYVAGANYASAASAQDNLRFTAAASSLATKAFNAVVFDSTAAAFTVSGSAATTLTVSSGALLFAGTAANAITLSGYTNISTNGTLDYIIHAVVNSVTIGSNLNSAVGLVKAGQGTLFLSVANGYTGGTWFNQGTIQVSALDRLGASGALNFQGGTLQWAAASTFDPSSRTINFNAGGGIFDVGANNVTIGSSVGSGGVGGFTKLGSGALTFSTAANYLGNTTISAGTLNLGAANALPTSTIVTVSSATGILNLNGFNQQLAGLLAGGTAGRVVNTTGTPTLTLSIADGVYNSFTGTLGNGASSNSFNVVKTGGGILEFITAAQQNFSGTLDILDGAVIVSSGVTLTTAASFVNIGTNGLLGGQGTISRSVTVAGNGVIALETGGTIGGTVTASGGNWNGAGVVTGVVTANGAGNFRLGTNAILTTPALNVTGGTISAGSTGSQLAGSLTYTSGLNSTFSATITGASSTVFMDNASSVLALGGPSTYGGATTVSAGTLRVLANGALGNTTGGTTVVAGATLELAGVDYAALEGLSLNGSGVGGLGALVASADSSFAGDINTGSSTTIAALSGVTLTLSGAINNFGPNVVTFTDSGNVWASGGFGGGTGNILKQGSGTLTVAGNSTQNNVTVSAGTLGVASGVTFNVSSFTVSGGTVSVSSGGTLSTTTINISSGTLAANGTLSGAVSVTGTGVLQGNGNWGDVTVASGGEVSPGNSVGSPSVSTLNFNQGGALVFEINDVAGDAGVTLAGWDLITITGTGANSLNGNATSGSPFTIHLSELGSSGFDANTSYSWDFLHYSTNAGVHNASLLANAFTFVIDSGFAGASASSFAVSFSDGTGDAYINYTAIPEPGTLLLTGLAAAGMGLYRRRQKRATKLQSEATQSAAI